MKCSTPKPEVKQSSVVVKALTTPRNKKCPQNPNPFQSVKNPKATTIAVPKNRVVAKALVFHSPKKPKQKKTSSELPAPVSKICQGMKQLEIASQRKRVLGYSVKSSRENERDSKKQLPTDASRRKFGTRKVKSRVYDSLRLQSCKGKEAKSSRCLKRKSQVEDLQKCNGSLPHEGVENDSSDMEIDEKPRDNSMDGGYEGNEHDKKSSQTAHSDAALPDTSKDDINSNPDENSFSDFQTLSEEGTKNSGGSDADVKVESSSILDPDDRDSEQAKSTKFQTQTEKGNESSGGSEHEQKAKSSPRKREMRTSDADVKVESSSILDPDDRDSEQAKSTKFQTQTEKGNESSGGSEHEQKAKSSPRKRRVLEDHNDGKENASASDDKENDSEAMENDDKENASASHDNR